jgi:tRNA (guanine-N7-)-methyltransferase
MLHWELGGGAALSGPRGTVLDIEICLSSLDGEFRWGELFENAGPVEVEIGFGKGRFLIKAAERFPEVNYLGIDRARRYLRIAKERLEKRGLLNVRLIRNDAPHVMGAYIPSSSVRAYHIYFPDPWWKMRHLKRRIFNPLFAAELKRTLRPGGRLYLASDVGPYFESIQGVLAEHTSFISLPKPLDLMAEAGYVPSNFEVKLNRAGHTIYRAVYQKPADSR